MAAKRQAPLARHRRQEIDIDLLRSRLERLPDVVVEPALWPRVSTEIAEAAGAKGAVLLQDDALGNTMPCSPSLNDVVDNYYRQNWHLRDLRTRGIPKILMGQVIGDDDVTTPDEMARHPYYNEMLRPFGFRWFAGVGFRADAGHWCLSIQRGLDAEMFSHREKAILATTSNALTQAATLSKITGQAALGGFTSALSLVNQPAILVSARGIVVDANSQVERLLGPDLFVKDRRLASFSPKTSQDLSIFMDHLRVSLGKSSAATKPLVIQRHGRRPILIRAVAINGAARTPFIGADAILLITDLGVNADHDAKLGQQVYGWSPAELRLVARLGTGKDLAALAEEFGITTMTIRYQLKAAMAKSETHSQGELIRLLERLPHSSSP